MSGKQEGKAKKTVGIILEASVASELESRAASMDIATGAYCKIILSQWLSSGSKLNLSEP